jgi:hypothetical protein
MKVFLKAALASFCLFIVGSVQAGIINFISLTESPSGLGESAWNTLSVTSDGVTASIKGYGTDDDSAQYAYLDWGNAGLGVCKDLVNSSKVDTAYPKSPSNNCDPSSDDNVTSTEYLVFTFSHNVVVKNVWFNNNHDGGLGAGDQALIQGNPYNIATGYAGGANGVGPFAVAMGNDFVVAFSNEQFYISGIEIMKVTEPSALLLFGLGLLSLTRIRRARND